jgi:hypothetical protein
MLVFVVIYSMSCSAPGATPRCLFDKEVIVKAQDLKVLKDQKYMLGPISKEVSVGCKVTLENGNEYISGKTCRSMMGEK